MSGIDRIASSANRPRCPIDTIVDSGFSLPEIGQRREGCDVVLGSRRQRINFDKVDPEHIRFIVDVFQLFQSAVAIIAVFFDCNRTHRHRQRMISR